MATVKIRATPTNARGLAQFNAPPARQAPTPSQAASAITGGVPLGVQLGMNGLKRSYGYVLEELLPQLQGRKAIQVYYEMSNNDPIIVSVLFAIDMFLRKVPWRVEPANQSKEAKENAAFLQSVIDDMAQSWPDFISEVNSMLAYGWSWFEILYKHRIGNQTDSLGNAVSKFNDGKVGWDKFDIRSQESWWRWDFDPDTGDTIGMWQRPAPDYSERYIPLAKSLHFRTKLAKNNPEGVSVLRGAYRPWYFKKRMEEIEGIGVERDLAGIPMAEVPAEMMGPNASDADKAMVQAIASLVQNVRRDQQEGIVWPQTWDEHGNAQFTFKLLTSGGTRQFPTDTIITRYESREAMVTLTDFILLGNDTSSGSFALSTSKTSMFQSALETWLASIENVINQQAVPRLMRLNGIVDNWPHMRHGIVQQPTLTDLATFISSMAGAGAQLFPDTGLENHLRGVALLPVRPEDDSASKTEEDIINQQLDTQLATSEAQETIAQRTKTDPNAEGIAPMGQGSIPVSRWDVAMAPPANGPAGAAPGGPAGKQPGSVKGAPTKSTGPVKSKLPPSNRRSTIADRAKQGAAPKTIKKINIMKFVPTQEFTNHLVHSYLSQHYPEKTLKWVNKADWSGPVTASLEDIDMSRRPGGRDPKKVRGIAKAIQNGKEMEPIVLVQTPTGKLKIADGYHRTLGASHAGKTEIRAYLGKVNSDEGPWDTKMHAAKLNKSMAKCFHCQNPAVMSVTTPDNSGSIDSCLNHVAQAQAEARWRASNQVSPNHPATDYFNPFPKVIAR